MTLRFRNRFKGEPSVVHECRCGRRMSVFVKGGRETVIHELPWCEGFETLMRVLEHAPDVLRHVAVVNVTGAETHVIADGDTVADVQRPPGNFPFVPSE